MLKIIKLFQNVANVSTSDISNLHFEHVGINHEVQNISSFPINAKFVHPIQIATGHKDQWVLSFTANGIKQHMVGTTYQSSCNFSQYDTILDSYMLINIFPATSASDTGLVYIGSKAKPVCTGILVPDSSN